MTSMYRWDDRVYNKSVRIIVSLTNIQVTLHPLRCEDGDFYRRYVRRLIDSEEDVARKRKSQQSEYRACRRERMALQFSYDGVRPKPKKMIGWATS